jgi:uncharacterized protein (TIGR02246 family)
MQSDEQAIRDWIHTWLEACKAGDTERCLSLLADDVVFMTVGQPPFGKKEFAGSPGQGKMKIEPAHDLREIRIAGDLAYTVSHLAVTVTPAGGEPMHLAGFILSVFRKLADGRWVLARDANLLTPVAPQR